MSNSSYTTTESGGRQNMFPSETRPYIDCLLYTSDAADDAPCVDLGGRRIIKKYLE